MKTLRDIRLRKGMTIGDVGELANVQEASISRIERGLQGVSTKTAVSLAKVYGISVEEIINRIDSIDSPGVTVPVISSCIADLLE